MNDRASLNGCQRTCLRAIYDTDQEVKTGVSETQRALKKTAYHLPVLHIAYLYFKEEETAWLAGESNAG